MALSSPSPLAAREAFRVAAVKAVSTLFCTNCGLQLRTSGSECPVCTEPVPRPSEIMAEIGEPKVICLRCSSSNFADARFCYACGAGEGMWRPKARQAGTS